MRLSLVSMPRTTLASTAALLVTAACATAGTLPPAEAETAAADARPTGQLSLEVNRSERQLYVSVDGEVVETHPVAVGQPQYPTLTGEWAIFQIDWNPDWTPPDSDWAQSEEYRAPGEPGNPMGRARLMFNPPYTIHGTEALESLGTAASHGSIRVSNEVAIRLGQMMMEYGDAPRDAAWVGRVLQDPTTMESVRIPDPIPIRVTD